MFYACPNVNYYGNRSVPDQASVMMGQARLTCRDVSNTTSLELVGTRS